MLRGRVKVLVPLVVLVAAGFAGCVDDGTGSDTDDADDALTVPLSAPTTPPSGASARDLLWEFAMGYPNRHTEDPAAHQAARDYLASQLEDLGLDVVRDEYSGQGTNILGIHPGATLPDQWVVLSCHYDTIRTTIYGARDDGLGCAAVLEMAASFATGTWNRTLVFAFFDEEEQGLIGSGEFARKYLEDPNVTLAANLNFDPAGLHWPCGDAAGPYVVHLMITLDKVEGREAIPGYAEVLSAVRDGFWTAGVPDEYVEVASRHAYLQVGDQDYLPPGSDDDSFDRLDIPSIWVGAPPTDQVGPVQVWGYPNHTPPDTAQLVEARCGSAETLEEGLQVAMDASLTALMELDGLRWAS